MIVPARTKHGMCHTQEYRTWAAIKDRCLNPGSSLYSRFGGRGVELFRPWAESFENFYADLGPKPGPKYRLVRCPVKTGNYEPNNVRWYYCGESTLTDTVAPKAASALVGKRFGHLLVTKAYTVRLGNGKPHAKLLCRCDCGKEVHLFWTALKHRRMLSCGSRTCAPDRFKKTTGAANYKFKGCGSIRASLWNAYREGARIRGIPFEITIGQAWEVYENQGKKCALSGVPIVFEAGKRSNTTASLDRIDSTGAYTLGNVQWVHKTVNLMKNVLAVEDFLDWCSKIAECSRSRDM